MSKYEWLFIVLASLGAFALVMLPTILTPSRQQRRVDKLKLQIQEERLKRELLTLQGREAELK